MSDEQKIAEQYFSLSNSSDMNGIKALLDYRTTYSSQNTGLYLGVEDIIEMQKSFHSSFDELHWNINSMQELKPGIVLIDYDFIGSKGGESITSSGLEYIIVQDSLILHIEIRNKA